MRANPCLFVVGCPRSGTTLLQRMLDSHSWLVVSNDSHFIPRPVELLEEADVPLTARIVEWVRCYRRFSRLGLDDHAVNRAANDAETYSDFVVHLYEELAAMHEKPLAGEKTPDYVRHLPLLHRLFPWAKILHIVRDGRDVALSTLEWAIEDKGPGGFALWKDQPIGVCALWWRWQVRSGTQAGRELGDQYREVKYENLIAYPQEELEDVCNFLFLPYEPRMATFYEGRTRSDAALSAKNAWLPPTPGLRDWRRDMEARDLELFEALAGDLLDELGYQRATTRISPPIASVADRCRVEWETEIARRAAKRARLREAHAAEARPVS